ncbi:MAG: M56 family metallopeptidase [Lachnospiraceae bacterium]|nr:M56 family metallopeptidase [Lachnospiraceae bacterium]
MGIFLEWMLESSLLVLMVLAIRKIFMGKVRYAAIYSLWIVVLLRFLMPVNLISTPISVANLFEKSLSAWNQFGAVEGEQKSGDAVLAGNGNGQSSSVQATVEETGNAAVQGNFSGRNVRLSESDSEVPADTEGAVGGARTASSVIQPLIRWYPVWQYGRLCIAALVLLWFLLSNASLLRAIRADRCYYGHRGNIAIYTVSFLHTPCLYGFLKPAIYLPESLVKPDSDRRVSTEELEQMILHEYVHYCHRDHIWGILRMLVVSIHWFDPFAWIAASCSKKDAELFCDETVIQRLGEENRFRYGRMLVRLAGNGRWGDFRYSMVLMSKRGREMEQRIRAISGKKRYSRWMLLPLGAVLAVAIGVTCSSGIGTLAGQDDTSEVKASVHTQESQTQKDTSAQRQVLSNADNYEEAFEHYIQTFTDAVNTGNIQELDQVLLNGSEVHQQQCAIVQNYHKRGIREEILNYSITSASRRTADLVSVDSSEEILVYYSDNTSKVVKQTYRYTCEYVGQGWIITEMQDIS